MEVESLQVSEEKMRRNQRADSGVWDVEPEEEEEEEEEEWKGHWTWSMDTYQPSVVKRLPPPSSDPPPSLQTLPMEITEMILALLTRRDKLSLAGTSFNILKLVAGDVYRAPSMDQLQASTFALARLEPSRNRIRRVLTPRTLVLAADLSIYDGSTDTFPLLIALTPSCYPPAPPISNGVESEPLPFPSNPSRPSIPLPKVSLAIDGFQDELTLWFPLLQVLNPRIFQISTTTSDPSNRTSAPTLTPVPGTHVDALCYGWDRLQCVIACGEESVPLSWSNDMAFSDRLERNRPVGKKRKETYMLRTHFRGQKQEEETMLEWEDLLDQWRDAPFERATEREGREGVVYETLVMRAWGGDAEREFGTAAAAQ
ncbi:hypothetical protein BDY24DRAFT_375542 [Mrakia frigida]|uniref:uncharacterized protein n=1 Tax=Mrakia frigida TaxID=29902 RepID=UPI003FCC1B5F